MSWLQSLTMRLQKYEKSRVDENDPFVSKLVCFLQEGSGMAYQQTVLDRTVKDVLALDEDLLAFVKRFIMDEAVDPGELVCEPYFTMDEFLRNTGYNPVTAAIFFQMYRQDRAAALKAFLMQDVIEAESQPEAAESKTE